MYNTHTVIDAPPLPSCKGCGKPFKPVKGRREAFCSQPCAARHTGRATIRLAQAANPQKRVAWVELTCPTCGRKYEKRLSQIAHYGAGYCSKACCTSSPLRAEKASYARRESGSYSAEASYSRSLRGWREIGDRRVFFRSRMEANYARFLTFCGTLWEYEPTTFWFKGIKRGVVSYTPDFYLPEEGEYLELKGWMDSKSATKLKRMAKYHPNVKLRLVEWKEYRNIAVEVQYLIPEWERD